MGGSICDIPGVKVGHCSDTERMTGCTVVLLGEGATGGMDPRGNATSLRQADSLRPTHMGKEIHAIYLTGGSAFGLDSAAGVMEYLEEQAVGLDVMYAKIPIVPAAVIFDVALGDHSARPDAQMARSACENATSEKPAEGSVGAGTGASVGKLYGIDQAMKGGVGTAGRVYPDGLAVGALAVVNPYGAVYDPDSGKLLAGPRSTDDNRTLVDMNAVLADRGYKPKRYFDNTVLVVVGTNAKLVKTDAIRLAQMSQTGLARVVKPCHSVFDGDVVFTFATGTHECDLQTLAAAASQLVAESIASAVKHADGLGHIPAWKDLQ